MKRAHLQLFAYLMLLVSRPGGSLGASAPCQKTNVFGQIGLMFVGSLPGPHPARSQTAVGQRDDVRSSPEASSPVAVNRPAAGPLKVHPDNPRYFTDGSGRPVYLTGSHLGWELQDDAWGREHTFNFPSFLEFLNAHNHNFLRLWMVEHTRWDTSNPKALATPMPYLRTGPGKALDGGLKFDLTKFEPEYFDRLRRRTVAAGKRGIYVDVMLFQGFSVHERKTRLRSPWFGHPFNRDNNINGVDGDANGDGDGSEIHMLANPEVTELQQAYVRKVVDTVGDLDNVLYEIGNECGAFATEWQYHMVRFVKKYETQMSKQHPVGMTVQIRGDHTNNRVLFDSPADWISPDRNDGYWTDPPAADGRKVILIDTDHIKPKPSLATHRSWIWKSFLRGHNPIFMDFFFSQSQSDRIEKGRPFDPQWEPIRRAMSHTRTLANRINLAAMTPHGELASTKFCLADPGEDYLVYLPQGGKARVDLTAATGSLSVEWIHCRSGMATKAGATAGGAWKEFMAPQDGDAVLYLVRSREK